MLDQNISFMIFLDSLIKNRISDVMPYSFLRNAVTTPLIQGLGIILLRE
jgi:hypothetical protein